MRKKKLGVASAAALAALALTLSGCASSNNTDTSSGGASGGSGVTIDATHSEGAMTNYAVGTTFKATEPIDISLLYRNHSNYPVQDGWMIFQQLQANQNVTFTRTDIDLADWQTKRGLYITADSSEPEVMPVFYSGEETQYVSSGALLPISDYVQYMPNFQKDLQDFGLSSYLDTKRQADGKYYQLPGLMEIAAVQYSVIVRDDYWKAAGLTSDPKNLDELQADLQKLKDSGQCSVPLSAGNDAKDIMQAWSPQYDTLIGDWAIQGGAQYWNGTQYVSAASQPGAQQLTQYMANLVSSGLMDADSMTQGTNDNNASDQKFVSGTSCADTGNDQDATRLQQQLQAQGVNTTVHMLPLPQAADGNTYITGGQRFSSGMVLGASIKNDPHFLAILQFLDWLYYSPEGVEFAQWGVQCPAGVTDNTKCTYTKDANGNRTLLPTVNNSQGLNAANCGPGTSCKMLNTDYGFSNGVFWPANGTFKDLILSYFSPIRQNFLNSMTLTERPTAPATPMSQDTLDQVATYAQNLRDLQNQWTADFIVGNKSVTNDWAAYQSALQGAGMDSLIQLYNDNVQK